MLLSGTNFWQSLAIPESRYFVEIHGKTRDYTFNGRSPPACPEGNEKLAVALLDSQNPDDTKTFSDSKSIFGIFSAFRSKMLLVVTLPPAPCHLCYFRVMQTKSSPYLSLSVHHIIQTRST